MIFLLQQNSGDAGGFLCCAIPVIVILIIVVVALAQANEQQAKDKSQKDKLNQKLDELNPLARTTLEKYLAGLPKINEYSFEMTCVVLADDFVFLDVAGRELDRIPRDSINQVIVDDKTQITQRLTVPRLLALGVFAFAAPKTEKHKTFCLVIDWDDDKGVRQNTVFEFTGEDSSAKASRAANVFTNHTRQKTEKLKSNEKKCPFCAETIKREAKLCRFCGSQLPEETEESAESVETDSPKTVEEKVMFDVVLQSAGSNPISVIREIRILKGLGLKEAKDLVDSAPAVVSYGVSRAEAEAARESLEKVGATVELK